MPKDNENARGNALGSPALIEKKKDTSDAKKQKQEKEKNEDQ